MVIFSSRRIQKSFFSETYRSKDFRLMKVKFKVGLMCYFVYLFILLFVGAIIMNTLFPVFDGNARQESLRLVTTFMAAIALHFKQINRRMIAIVLHF